MTLQKLELRPNEITGSAYCPVTGVCICGDDFNDYSPAAIMAWCSVTDALLHVEENARGDALCDAWTAFMQCTDGEGCLIHGVDVSDIELFLSGDTVREQLPDNCLLLIVWVGGGGCVSHDIPEICLINLDYEKEED
jgi:hypothetical protein